MLNQEDNENISCKKLTALFKSHADILIDLNKMIVCLRAPLNTSSAENKFKPF